MEYILKIRDETLKLFVFQKIIRKSLNLNIVWSPSWGIWNMYAQVDFLDQLEPKSLDQYLAKGWFRMGLTIFTTHFLKFQDQFYSAVWLRIGLKNFSSSKSQQKLFKQNSKFRTEIKPAVVDLEKEALFAKYKQGISFAAASSLEHLLYHDGDVNIYNTYEVNLYDGDKLIACGYFDLGHEAAAGISCFYDPDYKKYSLGKYLMLLKMEYCQRLSMTYFYPGYFVPGYPLFDYKLSLADQDFDFYELSSRSWQPIQLFDDTKNPLVIMGQKLQELEVCLSNKDIKHRTFYYDFFDANLMPELKDIILFDFPIFMLLGDFNDHDLKSAIIYDVRDQKYHWVSCRSIFQPQIDQSYHNRYGRDLLKVYEQITLGHTAQSFVSLIKPVKINQAQ